MARTLKLLHQLIDGSDATVLVGSDTSRSDVSIADNNVYRVSRTVADNYNVETLWTTGDGSLTTFTHGVIVSDQDILIEFRNDAGTDEFGLLQIKANTPFYFGPFLAAGTAAELSDGAQSVENTDFDSIDRIQVQRNVADNIGDATVTMVLLS